MKLKLVSSKEEIIENLIRLLSINIVKMRVRKFILRNV